MGWLGGRNKGVGRGGFLLNETICLNNDVLNFFWLRLACMAEPSKTNKIDLATPRLANALRSKRKFSQL